jgi:regulator of sigma E protease
MFLTLLIFILILGLLVFVHEFGHFWVAKKLGVTVHEFAFGFKPRLFSWKRGGTEYAINAIPLGGYVRLEGESEDTGKKGSFMAKSPKERALVLVAGVVMNLILAWVLLTITYVIGSYPLSNTFGSHAGVEGSRVVVVTLVSPNSPAQQAGIKAGDQIIALNGQSVEDAVALTETIKQQAGKEITIRYSRNGQESDTKTTPRVNPPAGEGAFGIGTGEASLLKAPWYKAPFIAVLEVGSQIKNSFVGFFQFVGQLIVRQEVNEDVSGIVGIGAATGIVRRLGIGPLLQFTALISTNLAVINILPILPLDGGHLLFAGLEAWRKKPIKDLYRQWMAIAGLAAILLLFLVVTYQDFLRFAIIDRIKDIF